MSSMQPPVLANRGDRVEFIQFQGKNTLSLRQLDELNGVVKGTTFRRFRVLETELVDGRDYFLLDGQEHAALLDSPCASVVSSTPPPSTACSSPSRATASFPGSAEALTLPRQLPALPGPEPPVS
jgi:hypothetical protein